MINLFNNKDTVQSVKIKDRFNKFYTMFIESRKSTEIEGYQVTSDIISKINSGALVDLNNILKPENYVEPVKVVEPKQSSVVIDTIKVEKKDIPPKEEIPEEEDPSLVSGELASGEFICDVCGGEFATKRGLEMHKSKAHK